MSYTHLSSSRPRAAKTYPCDWCWERIEAKTEYVKVCGVDGREFCASRYHPECHAAAQQAIEESGGFLEWTPGTFRRGSTEER